MDIAVVEDEVSLADELRELLIKLREPQVSIYESGEQFLFEYDSHPFDIVFMDIQMKRLNGLDTARELRRKDPHIAIVFLTNDPSFVFEGYEVDAVRYWLKPIQEEKLRELLESLRTPKPYILWNKDGELIKLYEDDIYYLESEGHYVLCHHRDRILRRKNSFKEQCEFMSNDFLLIHRSYCINMNHVRAVKKDSCEMENGDTLPVSRSMRVTVQEEFLRRCREELLCRY